MVIQSITDGHSQSLLTDGIIVCPDCRGRLTEDLGCTACAVSFESAMGVPVLLHRDSVFTSDQIIAGSNTFFTGRVTENKLKQKIRQSLPALALEYTQRFNDELVCRELPEKPLGLIVGAGEKIKKLKVRFPSVTWITTDVDLAYGPQFIADVTGLPLADNSIDLIVAEQVLEHVFDIGAAARELQRVCKTGGMLLIKIPFCLPWHGVPFDFYRCTPSGIRALFRSTERISIGQTMGAWGALAYQLDSCLVHLTTVRELRIITAFFSRFMFGWMKILDRFFLSKDRGLITSASITYVGRKRNSEFTAKEIIKDLEGLFHI
jgi:SAM-dependent methyltransferase